MADSCHVLQSLIFMMLGHMGETHTDGIPVQFIILFDFDISMDVTILYLKGQLIKSLYSQMCIKNVTSLRSYF